MNKHDTMFGAPVPYGLSIEELERRLHRPGPTAWAAIIVLADHPEPRALEVLMRYAGSPDWTFRRICIEAISHHQLAHDAAHLIVAGLRDPSPYVVRTACLAVARLGLDEGHDDLQALLSSREAATRQTAVRSLDSLWKESDFRPVFRLFLSDPSEAVRRDAAWTLAATAGAETWKELFEVWKGDRLPRHRHWACELAGKYGDDSVKAQLQALTNDRDGHVRKAAARILSRWNDAADE